MFIMRFYLNNIFIKSVSERGAKNNNTHQQRNIFTMAFYVRTASQSCKALHNINNSGKLYRFLLVHVSLSRFHV